MKRFEASLVALAAALLLVLPAPRVVSSPALFAAVNLTKAYSDPASDVQEFYTSNNTPVILAGNFVLAPTPNSANLLSLTSAAGTGNNVDITIKLNGKAGNGGGVGTTTNFTYVFDLYTDAADRVHYIVTYTGGTQALWLTSNQTGFTPVNITGMSSITSSSDNFRDQLTVIVDLSLIPSVTAWDVDVSAQERDAYYTYRDFIYLVPGHPGTSPALIGGHVFQADGTTPITDANVSTDIGGYYTHTDTTGAYTLYPAPGTYNITASKGGYNPATVQKSLGTQQVLQGVNFTLSSSNPLMNIGSWFPIIILVVLAVVVAVAALWVLRRRQSS